MPDEEDNPSHPSVKKTSYQFMRLRPVLAGVAFVGLTGIAIISQYPSNKTQKHRSLVIKPPNAYLHNPLKSPSADFRSKLFTTSNEKLGECNKNSGNLGSSKKDWKIKDIVQGCGAASRLGYSVALSKSGSTRMIVGSPFHPNKFGEQGPGFMEAFEFNDKKGEWVPLGRTYGKKNQDGYGFSVAISGDGSKAASGAPYHKAGRGSFSVTGGDCEKETFTVKGPKSSKNLGYAVAADKEGNRFAVGAPAFYGTSRRGNVFIYDSRGGLVGDKLTGDQDGDGFGMAVSISSDGKFVAVGSPLIDNNVKIYKWNGSKYKRFGKPIKPLTDFEVDDDDDDDDDDNDNDDCDDDELNPKDDNYNDGDDGDDKTDKLLEASKFGNGVSLSEDGKTVAIGAPSQTGSMDYVRVFTWHKDAWTSKGDVIYGELYSFGSSVSLSLEGNWLSIGDPSYEGEGQQARGRVCVFYYNSSKNRWEKQGNDVIGSSPFDNAGFSTALTKDKCKDIVVAVGCPMSEPEGFQSGMVGVMQFGS